MMHVRTFLAARSPQRISPTARRLGAVEIPFHLSTCSLLPPSWSRGHAVLPSHAWAPPCAFRRRRRRRRHRHFLLLLASPGRHRARSRACSPPLPPPRFSSSPAGRGHAHPRFTNFATMLRNFVKGPGFLGGSGTCSAELVAVVGDDRGSAAGLGFGGVGAGFGFGGGGAGLGPFFLPLLSSTSAEIVPVLPAEKLITLAPKVFTAMAAASGPPSCCTITPHATASRASTARASAVNESFGRRFVTAKGGTGDPTRTLLEPTSLMGALIAPFKCVVPRDGDGEAAGAIGCDFLGLRFDGEEFFCCDGLRRAGELACRGGIFAAVQIPVLEQDSCFFIEGREAWSQYMYMYPDTVTRQSRTSVRTPAVRNPQFSVVWSV